MAGQVCPGNTLRLRALTRSAFPDSGVRASRQTGARDLPSPIKRLPVLSCFNDSNETKFSFERLSYSRRLDGYLRSARR